MEPSKQAKKISYDAVGGFQPSWKDISQIGKRIKTCLKTPPTPLKTNMTFRKSTIFLRKYIFKCWSFQCQKSKIPHAIRHSEVPLDSTNLGSVSVSPLGLASGVAWPTKKTPGFCVCTNKKWMDG